MDIRILRISEARLPTSYGEFRVIAYRAEDSTAEHIAMVMGDPATAEPVLTRVHDECLTGDVFGSLRCDCGEQLRLAMERIVGEGRGILLYLRQEGRGIGLHNKIQTYALQDQGLDTVEANEALGFPADVREYIDAAKILHDLGVTHIRLMTNNPAKMSALQASGLIVVERIPLQVPANEHSLRYLVTKRDKMGHDLDLGEIADPESVANVRTSKNRGTS